MKQTTKTPKALATLDCRKLYMGGGKNLLVFLLLLFITTNTIKAQQLIDTYFYPDDLKGYSTEAVPGTDDYVMAGTKYNGSDFNQIHFLYFQSTNMVVSKYYTLQSGSQNDIRVIDIVAADANTFYITCLYRDNFGAFSGLDRIKVLGVDASGSIILDENIGSVIGNNGHYDNIYPLHSIFLNGALFICGYVNEISSSYPYEPYYMGPVGGSAPDFRKAFVIKYDIGAGGTLAGKCWDYTITGNPQRTDYDMAIRMVPLSNGYIYVTGSCNVPVTASSTTYYPSGTLSIFLDPTTLNAISNLPFSYQGIPLVDPTYGDGEYGVGIIEDPNSNGYFVIGNYFTSPNPISQIMFYPRPSRYWFTYLDGNSLVPPITYQPTRLTCDWPNTWLLQNLQGNSSTDFLLAGMTMSNNTTFSNCTNLSPIPSTDNLDPFLALVSPTFNFPSISLATTFQHVYLSNLGTGSESLDPNSYMRLGTGLSNVAWNPTFAARNDLNITTDITMNAPIWNNTISPNKLNFKLIRTDQNGDIPNPCDYYTTCTPTYHDEDAQQQSPNIITDDYYVSLLDDQDYDTDYPYDQLYECDGTYYRSANPSGSLNTHSSISVKIFPNPTKDYVNIRIMGLDKDKNVNVELISITGAHIANLYSGTVNDKENKKIALPDLSSGLYYVRIMSESKVLSTQKLTIQ